MAADQAMAAVIHLREFDWILIHGPKRDRMPDVLVLMRSVYSVAGLATSSLTAIHMQVVKVLAAIAKVGECRRFGVTCDVRVVAHEAEVVKRFGVGVVEIRRKIFNEQQRLLATMCRVAGGAVVVGHGAVLVRLVGETVAHFTVTGSAQLRRMVNQ